MRAWAVFVTEHIAAARDCGDDRHLRRQLGFWPLTAIAVSGVIGSGWLLSAMFASQAAGPASEILPMPGIGSTNFGGIGAADAQDAEGAEGGAAAGTTPGDAPAGSPRSPGSGSIGP